jgi:Protein of unknown function (DUF4235)
MAAEGAAEGDAEGAGTSRLWTVLTLLIALTAAGLARKAVAGSWRVATGKKPPENPADPDVDSREAIAWAILSAVAIGLARVLAQRKMAGYYSDSLGRKPPESKVGPRKLNQLRG